jgi:predicted esterase
MPIVKHPIGLTIGLLSLIISFSFFGCLSSSSKLVKIQPTESITQGFILITPEKPVANVILFSGGDGVLKLTSGTTNNPNFLVRSRLLFAENGFQVAVVDAPRDKFGYMSVNRHTEEHRKNIRSVANYLKGIADVPIWLIGTSRGTDSVANIAINDPDLYSGAVFTSTVQDAIFQDTDKITMPSLVVHHRKDGCAVCQPSVAEKLYDSLIQSETRKILWFDGGGNKGNPCWPWAYHGFNGIERKVVDAIAKFIIENN